MNAEEAFINEAFFMLNLGKNLLLRDHVPVWLYGVHATIECDWIKAITLIVIWQMLLCICVFGSLQLHAPSPEEDF